MTNMVTRLVTELREFASELDEAASKLDKPALADALARVEAAAEVAAKAWSGSNIGYQSRVYYANLEVPPPGAHFDSEWGFGGQFQGTTGDWREFRFDDVINLIYQASGVTLEAVIDEANRAHETWTRIRPEVVSVIVAYLAVHSEALIEGLRSEAEATIDLTEQQAARALLGPARSIMTRDSTALSQGITTAPHQVVQAKVITIRSRFAACVELAAVARRAAAHMERVEGLVDMPLVADAGARVFIGHGGSNLWRELKDFVSDDLGLPWDEFNRVPVAGVTTVDRLAEMLDNAGIAFLVLTAEDETVDGRDVARQNVVHEVGLFQSRLGFRKAIVLLEEGCDEFSNIRGLTQIRFPSGNIRAAFHDVRGVLRREGFA